MILNLHGEKIMAKKEVKEKIKNLLEDMEKAKSQLENVLIKLSGNENEVVKHKLTELHIQSQELLSRKITAEAEQNELEQKIKQVESNIKVVSENKENQLLKFLQDNKWLYFKHKEHIVFNKDTGLLWQNHKTKPLETKYYPKDALGLAINLKLNGLDDWILTSREELKNNFLVNSHYNLPQEHYYWTRDSYKSSYQYYYKNDLSESSYSSGSTYYCLFNNTLFLNNNFAKSKPNYETEKKLLDFFINKGDEWELSFNDKQLSEIYLNYVIRKKLLDKIRLLETELTKLGFDTKDKKYSKKSTQSTFNSSNPETRSDNNSFSYSLRKQTPYEFYKFVQNKADEKLEELKEIVNGNEDLVDQLTKLSNKITSDVSDTFSKNEIDIIKEREILLKNSLTIDYSYYFDQILEFRNEAENINTQIKEICLLKGDCKLEKLSELENQNLPSINLMSEIISGVISDLENRLEYLEENADNLTKLVELHNNSLKCLGNEIESVKSEFIKISNKLKISKYQLDINLKEVREYYFEIEKNYTMLIEQFFKENFDFEIMESVIIELDLQKENVFNAYKDKILPNSDKPKAGEKEEILSKIINKTKENINKIVLGA
jgi:hypothetical protein